MPPPQKGGMYAPYALACGGLNACWAAPADGCGDRGFIGCNWPAALAGAAGVGAVGVGLVTAGAVGAPASPAVVAGSLAVGSVAAGSLCAGWVGPDAAGRTSSLCCCDASEVAAGLDPRPPPVARLTKGCASAAIWVPVSTTWLMACPMLASETLLRRSRVEASRERSPLARPASG